LLTQRSQEGLDGARFVEAHVTRTVESMIRAAPHLGFFLYCPSRWQPLAALTR
jgi:hypothetical protein